MLGFKHLQKKHAQWAQTLKSLAELGEKPGCPLKPIPPPMIREYHDSQIELSKFGEGVTSKVTSSMNVTDDQNSATPANQTQEPKPSVLIKNRTPINCRIKMDKSNNQALCASQELERTKADALSQLSNT